MCLKYGQFAAWRSYELCAYEKIKNVRMEYSALCIPKVLLNKYHIFTGQSLTKIVIFHLHSDLGKLALTETHSTWSCQECHDS